MMAPVPQPIIARSIIRPKASQSIRFLVEWQLGRRRRSCGAAESRACHRSEASRPRRAGPCCKVCMRRIQRHFLSAEVRPAAADPRGLRSDTWCQLSRSASVPAGIRCGKKPDWPPERWRGKIGVLAGARARLGNQAQVETGGGEVTASALLVWLAQLKRHLWWAGKVPKATRDSGEGGGGGSKRRKPGEACWQGWLQ